MDIEAVDALDPGQVLSLLTVQELKASKRITHSMEDAFLEDCILTAYEFFDGPDGWLRRSILPRAYQAYRTSLPGKFELPLGPLLEVANISVLTLPTVSYVPVSSGVYTTINSHVPRVCLLDGQTWPDVLVDERAVLIEFTAGWELAKVPRGVRAAIRLLAGSLYEHREADFEDQRVSYVSRKIEYGIERFAGRHRVLNDQVDPV